MDWIGKTAELQRNGYCVLRARLPKALVDACRTAFWPTLLRYLENRGDQPNRGPHRHFLPMPFEPPCFAPEFFFDAEILHIVRGVLGPRIVADQWGCDVPIRGSDYQRFHVDYRRPLFEEVPDLALPPYMLVVSFGLIDITAEHGPIEIARSITSCQTGFDSVLLDIGDVLIRHPRALHRGTPNVTDTPRAMATVRYVRHWYADSSREVNAIPGEVWDGMSEEQKAMMRFPIGQHQ